MGDIIFNEYCPVCGENQHDFDTNILVFGMKLGTTHIIVFVISELSPVINI